MVRAVQGKDAGDTQNLSVDDEPSGAQRVLTRIDAHVHSNASDKPVMAAAGWVGAPECYTEPERVYDMAMARGMDLVTITDHDTIRGAMTLVERGFERFVVGQEVSVRFPEDRCLLHVLVWGLTPHQDERLTRLGLREDVYRFAAWLREEELAHAVAHPLYVQNGRLTRWHVERAALLFKGFETLNGAHSERQSRVLDRVLATMNAGTIHRLVSEHNLEPHWPRVWEKARTGGSDDHGALNIGRTWTQVTCDAKVHDGREFFRRVMSAQSESGGDGGHSALLAHQITTVGANYYADRMYKKRSPTGRYISAKLLKFAAVPVKPPSKKRVAAHKAAQSVWMHKKSRAGGLPIVQALRDEIGGVLERHPEIRGRLEPEAWPDGSALSDHERMADFAEDLILALSRAMEPGLVKSMGRRDPGKLGASLSSYMILHAAQLPYLFSLFHQNKERPFLRRLEHETGATGEGRAMKVMLFTDTLADVNGVSRFIQNTAQRARESGRELEVVTSTRMECPEGANIRNFAPIFATKMPRYENLELALPPLLAMLRHADKEQPDAIHVSTPGPVGMVGWLAARMLKAPVLGVYHTDFPAYIDQLFDDHALTETSRWFMRAFYKRFASIFTRSADYADSLETLGMDRGKLVRLRPGFDNQRFNTTYRDESVWDRLGSSRGTVKVLSCGRVSVEKNLPMLAGIWKRVEQRCADRGVEAELIVVGDGPYRERMGKELKRSRVNFVGFRHGDELSTIYASSDMFVFPSTTDTLGQVVMESQASGLPVLVSDQGGPKEVVRDGETGFVLPSGDPAAWIDRIVDLACDPGRRRSMGEAGRAYMEGFGFAESFEHFWSVHERAVSKADEGACEVGAASAVETREAAGV